MTVDSEITRALVFTNHSWKSLPFLKCVWLNSIEFITLVCVLLSSSVSQQRCLPGIYGVFRYQPPSFLQSKKSFVEGKNR